MFKVLVVDDENMIRLAMGMMIDWKEFGFELIGAAQDGRQAVQMVKASAPDLVITDIQMPEMNGLELITWLKENDFHGEILILSNYDDFELVRAGLRSGAYDYLLKVDLSGESLSEKMTEMKEVLDKKIRKRTRHMNIKQKPLSLSADRAWSAFLRAEQADLTFFVPENCRLYYVSVLREQASDESNMRIQALERLLNDIRKGNADSILLTLSQSRYLLIDGGADCFSTEIAEKIQNQVELYLNLRCHIVRTGILADASGVFCAYKSLCTVMESLFYKDSSIIVRIPCKTPSWAENMKFSERQAQEQLSQMLLYGDYTGAVQWIQAFLSEQKDRQTSPKWLKSTIYSLLNGIYYVLPYREEISFHLELLDKKVRHAGNICELKRTAEEFLSACNNKHRNVKREVLELIDYINQHLQDHLTLTSLKSHVNLSEKYMCTIFKKETGTSIINYINEKRMEKAAELLSTSDLRLKEIGEQVGIPDSFYFSKMFKKYYDVSPSQFRSKSL